MKKRIIGVLGAMVAAASLVAGGVALLASPSNATNDNALAVMTDAQLVSAKAAAMRGATSDELAVLSNGVTLAEYEAAMQGEIACISNALTLAGVEHEITAETSPDEWQVTRTVEFFAGVPTTEAEAAAAQQAYDALAEGCHEPTDRVRRVYQAELRADESYVERVSTRFAGCLTRVGVPTKANAKSMMAAFRGFDPISSESQRPCFEGHPSVNMGVGMAVPNDEQL